MNRNCIPLTSIGDLTIFDVAEEENAVLNNYKTAQRFRYIIHYIVDGEGTYKATIKGKSVSAQLGKNQLFVVIKNSSVLYYSNPVKPLHYYWVGFDGQSSEQILESVGLFEGNITMVVQNGDEIIEAFDQLIRSWDNQNQFELYSKFFNLIYIMGKDKRKNYGDIKNIDDDVFIKFENYLQMNIGKPIKLSEVAEKLNFDRCYFSKLFKRRYQISPYAYIIKTKLYYAEVFLKTSNYSITKIADLTGFPDTFAFSNIFKKYYGYAPSEYRKIHQEKGI